MVRERNPCVCISTRTGSLIVGWLSVVTTILHVIFIVCKIIAFYDPFCEKAKSDLEIHICASKNDFYVKLGLIAFAISTVLLVPPISLIYGTLKNRAGFLIPFIVYGILVLIGLLVLFSEVVTAFRVFGPELIVMFGFWAYGTVVVWFHYVKLRNEQRSGVEVSMSVLTE